MKLMIRDILSLYIHILYVLSAYRVVTFHHSGTTELYIPSTRCSSSRINHVRTSFISHAVYIHLSVSLTLALYCILIYLQPFAYMCQRYSKKKRKNDERVVYKNAGKKQAVSGVKIRQKCTLEQKVARF